MMPVRRMKIKAAPNISKKVTILSNTDKIWGNNSFIHEPYSSDRSIPVLTKASVISMPMLKNLNKEGDIFGSSETCAIEEIDKPTGNLNLEEYAKFRPITKSPGNGSIKSLVYDATEDVSDCNANNFKLIDSEDITKKSSLVEETSLCSHASVYDLNSEVSMNSGKSKFFYRPLSVFNSDAAVYLNDASSNGDETAMKSKYTKGVVKLNNTNFKVRKELKSYSRLHKKYRKGCMVSQAIIGPPIRDILKDKGKTESDEKTVFNERKLKYKQKLLSGSLEPSTMTMFDLIFWNPSNNPMPQNEKSIKPGKSSTSANIELVNSEAREELLVEEAGLANGSNSTIDANKENFKKLPTNDDMPIVAPQVKIGPDGELVVDEKSLLIPTTASKNRDKILSSTEVVEETNDSSYYGKWSKRRRRATEWTKKETSRFYKALSTVGTDFSLMSTVFSWRSRSELKIKFKKEERINQHLIDTALNDCTQFDFSIFDESDYDPEEDRKESKGAEKAGTKRRREKERQREIEAKQEERMRRKRGKANDKIRKQKLKEVFKKRGKRNDRNLSQETNLEINEDSDESLAPSVVIEPEEVVCEVVFAQTEKIFTEELGGTVIACDSDVLKNRINNVLVASIEKSRANEPPRAHYFPLCKISEDSRENYVRDKSLSTSHCNTLDTIDFGSSSFVVGSTNESGRVKRISTTLTDDNGGVPSFEVGEQELAATGPQICFPPSCIQKSLEGFHYVEICTPRGIKKIPVPAPSPSTSNVVVMATHNPQDPTEQIFHVYLVSPIPSTSKQCMDLENNRMVAL